MRLPETAPNGSRIVAACGMQPVYAGIKSFDDDGITIDHDNVTPAAGPSPVHCRDGSLLLVAEDGDFWSAHELVSGIRDNSADHHIVAAINRGMAN